MQPTMLSYGLGADSTAILLKFLADPAAYGLQQDLSDLIVVHAVTGDEWPDSLAYAARHVLPLLRDRQIRLVQVARGGDLEADGIVVLSDSRAPYRIHSRGPWRLSEHLIAAGTVPTLANGMRTCSAKAKGFVLDRWAADEFGRSPYRRVIGYHYDELDRAEKDTSLTLERNATGQRGTCVPSYPLIDERLRRAEVEAYVLGRLGEPIRKSYCTMCCFSGVCASRAAHEERLRDYPELAAATLRMEYLAMALNENSSLYGKTSLYRNLTEDTRNAHVLQAFVAALDADEFALYEVRRIYFARRTADCRTMHGERCQAAQWWCQSERTQQCRDQHLLVPGNSECAASCRGPSRKGNAWRSVRTVLEGSRRAVGEALTAFAGEADSPPESGPSGIPRVWYRRPDGAYPSAEGFLVAAPVGAADKQRAKFEAAWTTVTGLDGLRCVPLRSSSGSAEQLLFPDTTSP
jgi:hypothetical protein